MNALVLSIVGLIYWPAVPPLSFDGDPTVAPHFPAVARMEWPVQEIRRSTATESPPDFLRRPTVVVD